MRRESDVPAPDQTLLSKNSRDWVHLSRATMFIQKQNYLSLKSQFTPNKIKNHPRIIKKLNNWYMTRGLLATKADTKFSFVEHFWK